MSASAKIEKFSARELLNLRNESCNRGSIHGRQPKF